MADKVFTEAAAKKVLPVVPTYFTPGLLSCLIVSLILILILSIAISWVSSLDISYGSFEKKVEHGKKAQ